MAGKAGEVINGPIKTVRNPPDAVGMHNAGLARTAGFKGGLILNEYHFTQISEMLIERFGLGWLTHGELEMRYIAPLFGGDTFVHAPSSGKRVEKVGLDHVYWGPRLGQAGRLEF